MKVYEETALLMEPPSSSLPDGISWTEVAC